MNDILERETPYVKSSRKVSPPKTDHRHEYIRPVTHNRIRRFDGSVSTEKYEFSLNARCIDCGHVNRKAYSKATKIELSVREYKKLEAKEKN